MTRAHLPIFPLCLALLLARDLARPAVALAGNTAAAPAKPGRVRDSLKGEAQAAFDRGNELFRDGDLAGARAEYDRAHTLGREPRILYNVAACDKGLRRYVRAIAALDASLAEGGAALPPDYIALVNDTRAVLEPFVSTLTVVADETGADVLVDGEVVGVTPLSAPLPIEVGEHTVLLRKAGLLELPVKVSVTSGVPATVKITAKTATPPAPAPLREGRLHVTADEETTLIYVDGKQVGLGDYSASIASGEHRIRLVRPDVDPYTADVIVRGGETRTISVTLGRKSRVPVWLWVTGAVAVAAGGTALVLVATTRTSYNGAVPGTYDPKVIRAGINAGGLSW